MKTLWFHAKRYGYGWTPSTWQGWLVIAVYVVLLIATFRSVDLASHSVSDTLFAIVPFWIVYTVALVIICVLTGEKPRWRWGN